MEFFIKHQNEIAAVSPIALGVLTYLYKKGLVPLFHGIKRAITAIDKIEIIHKELYSNGGSSVRDALNRIESSQDLIENRSRSIMMASRIGSFETDSQGRLNWANRAFVAMAERQVESLAGLGWITSINAEDQERVGALWKAAVADQRDLDCDTEIMNHETGDLTGVHLRAYVMRDRKGNVQGWIGYAQRVN